MPEASPEWFGSLCPQLPGLMEKSMSAAECFVSSCLWSLPAGQALHCWILLQCSENRTLNSSLLFPPGSLHLGLCYLSLHSLNGAVPACFPDYAFKRKHIFVRRIKRQHLEVSAWISVDLPSPGALSGGAGQWVLMGACKPSSVGWFLWDSTGHWPWTSKTSVDGPPTTAGGFLLFLRSLKGLTIQGSNCIGNVFNSVRKVFKIDASVFN